MPVPTSQSCLASKHPTPEVTHTAFGYQMPNSVLARPKARLVLNGKDTQDYPLSKFPGLAGYVSFTETLIQMGGKPSQAARQVNERKLRVNPLSYFGLLQRKLKTQSR